jgi:hypothetical protein
MIAGQVRRALAEFGGFSPAEQALIDGLGSGETLVLSGLPEPGDATREVRAEMIRVLALGYDAHHPPHEKGVRLAGAWISGALDLEGCRIARDLVLEQCRFEAVPVLRSAVIDSLFLRGSDMPGLEMDRLETRGGVLLQNAAVRGAVELAGARIGADLDCGGARMEALDLNRARVAGVLFLGAGFEISGVLDLTDADLGAICDERASWPGAGMLGLDRCAYEAFACGPVDAAARLDWLALQASERNGSDFWPQPYEQVARVLRSMGRYDDARLVLVGKERLARRTRIDRETRKPFKKVLIVWDRILDATIRYGEEPLRAFVWIGCVWFIGFVVFGLAAFQDALEPSDIFVQRAAEWVLCGEPEGGMFDWKGRGGPQEGLAQPGQSQRDCFLQQPGTRTYPDFNAAAYSLNTILPISALQQQDYWMPDEVRPIGVFARGYLWFHTLAGWMLSLMAIAGFTGLVKSQSL